MSTELKAQEAQNTLPAHLQGGKKAKFGDIDSSDLIVPRIKLLQGTSPEITEFENAKVGQFWHTIAQESLGPKLRIVPLVLRKSTILWAPRGDERGVLARSSDNRNWDKGFENLAFDVKLKDRKMPVRYETLNNIAESGLDKFGSSNPDEPNSRPAASLTYNMLFYFPDYHQYSPAIVINTRSSIKAAKGLISKIELRPVDHFDQVFVMGTTDENGAEGPYKGYSYTADGYTTAEMHDITKSLYDKFEPTEWRASEETDDDSGSSGSGGGTAKGSSESTKF